MTRNEESFANKLLYLTGPQLEKPVSLTIPGQYFIGSAADADLHFPRELEVEPRHAVLMLEPTSMQVRSMDPRVPVFLNGTAIERSTLEIGDRIRCGTVSITIDLRSSDPLTETLVSASAIRNLEAEAELLPVIKGYAELRPIGHGALGSVFQARQLGTNRTVAIKCIRPELQADERARQLFIREASVSTQLKHARIVDYLGFGFSGSLPYLVMEYIPAENLETIVWRHKPERRVRLAVKIVMQVLEALEFAHEAGIVHRDIKPSNILATTTGNRLRLKVSDFGLAKIFSTAGHSGITASNDVCGTLAYMSPEQLIDSRSAKPESDVYSAVVCLYRLLTREFPHPEGNPAQMIHRRLHDPPRPIQHFSAEVPDDLARIVDLGLCRSVEMRHRSAATLHAALAALPLLRNHS
jgi:eukaryotic-like serine/threonine-protein kinase